jgi:hypothetical protein
MPSPEAHQKRSLLRCPLQDALSRPTPSKTLSASCSRQRAHHHRRRIPQPQRATPTSVQGLHGRAEAPHYTADQTRPQTPRRRRARQRISRTITAWAATTWPTQASDAINAILAAVGYNFRLLIRWLLLPLWQLLVAIAATPRLKFP